MLKFFYYEMNKKDLISKKKAIFNYIKLNNLFDNILYKEYIEEEKKVNNNKKDFNFSILNILIINYFFSNKDIISHINLIDEKYYKLKKNEYLAYKNKTPNVIEP